MPTVSEQVVNGVVYSIIDKQARQDIASEVTNRQNEDALKVNISDIENDLTGTTAGKVLDARQGKVLSDKISAIQRELANNENENDLVNTDKIALVGYFKTSDGNIVDDTPAALANFSRIMVHTSQYLVPSVAVHSVCLYNNGTFVIGLEMASTTIDTINSYTFTNIGYTFQQTQAAVNSVVHFYSGIAQENKSRSESSVISDSEIGIFRTGKPGYYNISTGNIVDDTQTANTLTRAEKIYTSVYIVPDRIVHSVCLYQNGRFVVGLNMADTTIEQINTYDFNQIGYNFLRVYLERGETVYFNNGEINKIKNKHFPFTLEAYAGYWKTADGQLITASSTAQNAFSFCQKINSDYLLDTDIPPFNVCLYKDGEFVIGLEYADFDQVTNYEFDQIAYSFTRGNVAIGDEVLFKTNKTAPVYVWNNKKANFIGDSITFGTYYNSEGVQHMTDGRYCDIACDILNIAVCNNYGISGTSISSQTDQKPNQSFTNRYNAMTDDADLIVVAGGTNDYGTGVPLGTSADTTDISFYGALYVLCNGLQSKYLGKRIVFITPIPRINETTPNADGHTLQDYRNAINEIVPKFGFPVIDGKSLGVSPVNSSFKATYIYDGTHPNPPGHKVMGQALGHKLLSI